MEEWMMMIFDVKYEWNGIKFKIIFGTKCEPNDDDRKACLIKDYCRRQQQKRPYPWCSFVGYQRCICCFTQMWVCSRLSYLLEYIYIPKPFGLEYFSSLVAIDLTHNTNVKCFSLSLTFLFHFYSYTYNTLRDKHYPLW